MIIIFMVLTEAPGVNYNLFGILKGTLDKILFV